jgi:hypothetical protein
MKINFLLKDATLSKEESVLKQQMAVPYTKFNYHSSTSNGHQITAAGSIFEP